MLWGRCCHTGAGRPPPCPVLSCPNLSSPWLAPTAEASPGVPLSDHTSPAWKSIPTASEVPDTGTRASDLSLGSRGMPRIPSWTEYRRKEPTPVTETGTMNVPPDTVLQGEATAHGKPHDCSTTEKQTPSRAGARAPPQCYGSAWHPHPGQMAQDSRRTSGAALPDTKDLLLPTVLQLGHATRALQRPGYT